MRYGYGSAQKSAVCEAKARQAQFAARETRDNFKKSLAKTMARWLFAKMKHGSSRISFGRVPRVTTRTS